ncbi:MAG: SUMF1/EgtB/PvdO family nonheme iron enzyme [Kiritimatiellae bacterium]|nr:SUMF1/EgtB/PvdO family nonheme iron enzyme [Kiritimatiellia bacterium]
MNKAVASFTAACAASMLAATANAAVELADVTVSQGTGADPSAVTVSYSLSNGGEPAYVTLDVLTNGVSVGFDHIKTARGDISQLDAHLVADDGAAKSIVWPMRKDWPDQLLPDATVRLQAWYTNAIPPMYLVVDLSGGTAAESFPYRYTSTAPDLASSTCRTTELWLRQCPAGSFTMGTTITDSNRNYVHPATLTNSFWCGVFEVTKAQYALVMGDAAASAAAVTVSDGNPDGVYPMNNMSATDLRGAGSSYYGWATDNVADGSFFGVLRAKTGLAFDLPTETQWEYACRAGSTGEFCDPAIPSTGSGLGDYAWYSSNANDHTRPVGTKAPNAWGLYDVHGNVYEACLDAFQDNGSRVATTNFVASNFLGGNKYNIVRGGCYNVNQVACACGTKVQRFTSNDTGDGSIGFRVWLTIGKWR